MSEQQQEQVIVFGAVGSYQLVQGMTWRTHTDLLHTEELGLIDVHAGWHHPHSLLNTTFSWTHYAHAGQQCPAESGGWDYQLGSSRPKWNRGHV
eukprot:1158692-Pelagomonas_calceolata.AAC.3